jgi:hypothetical protein
LRDFRRHEGAAAGPWSQGLHEDYRRAHAQREQALELYEVEDAEPPSTWRIAPLPSSDETLAAAARRPLLDFAPLPLPGGSGTVYDHLNAWIAALETTGVMVLATAGGRVPASEMQAFSLYFDMLPVIVINGADAARGRLFSALQEKAAIYDQLDLQVTFRPGRDKLRAEVTISPERFVELIEQYGDTSRVRGGT